MIKIYLETEFWYPVFYLKCQNIKEICYTVCLTYSIDNLCCENILCNKNLFPAVRLTLETRKAFVPTQFDHDLRNLLFTGKKNLRRY